MSVATPEWLARHGGELRANPDEGSWAVYFYHRLQYLLIVFPASGKYSCRVKQTVNGVHLESGSIHPSPETALQGGLEDLRKALGW